MNPSTAIRICENCRHMQSGQIDPSNIGAPRPLLCKRYPPTLSLLSVNGNVVQANGHPTVPPGGTCGEWAPVLAS